jgi:uncharacterized DUF497 family protein
MAVQFEWNSEKAKINLLKHKISFEEAQTVFDDPFFIDFFDPNHSITEDRFIIIGMSEQNRLLVVSYTERLRTIRLISAREATRKENEDYEENK